MKHYFYFVRNLNGFSSDDVVFKVAVGTSMRDQVKMELVRQFANDCGMYFHQVSEESDRAIDLLSKSLFPGTAFSLLYLKRANVTISELYRMILDDSLLQFEKCLAENRNKFRLLSQLSPSFFFLNHTHKCITTCQPYRRKYLSQREGMENTHALIGFCLILALFLLSGYLEGLERCTF